MKKPQLNLSRLLPNTLETTHTQTQILSSRVYYNGQGSSRVSDTARNPLGLRGGQLLTQDLEDSAVKLPIISRKASSTLSQASQGLETRFKKVEQTDNPIIQKIIDIKHRVYYFLKLKDAEGSINELVKLVNTVVDLNDMSLFHRNLELLGDLSICNADYRGAIHFYNKLRQLAEYTRNNEWKIQSLILLADTCQLMKKYSQAKKFLRKALQYVWFEQKKEQEPLIYDKLGVLYYLEGDVVNATKYHERSVGYLLEQDTASLRHSNENTRKYLKQILYHTDQITVMLLAKLGMVGEKGEEISGVNKKHLKITTTVDADQQLDIIQQEDEFQMEIASPAEHKGNLTKNGYISEELYYKFPENVVRLHRIQSHNQYFQRKNSVLTSKERILIDKSLLKMTLDEQIRLRQNYKNSEQQHVSLTNQIRQIMPKNPDKMMYNHLTPNRNWAGFNYHYKPTGGKVKKFFEALTNKAKIVSQQA